MGINGGSAKLYYSITDQTDETIIKIAKHRAERRSRDITRIPVLDIDASWVVRSFGNNNDDSNVLRLCKLSLSLVHKGLHVVIVCDGSVRHPSKRATIQRKADCRRNHVIARNNRIELSLLNQEIDNTLNVEEKATLVSNRTKLLKETEAKERAIQRSSISVGDDMYDDIEDEVNEEQYCLPIRNQTEWWYQKCDYKDCRSMNMKLKRIAPPIKHSKSSLARNYEHRAKLIRQTFREECLARIGIKKNDTTECVRICYYHKVEEVTKDVRYKDLQGRNKIIKVIMNVPVQYKPPPSCHHRRNRGTGRFRAVYNRLKEAQTNIETATTSAERADLIERMMYQKHFGGEENIDDNQYIDSEVSDIVGITKSDNDYDMKPLQVVDYMWKRGGRMEYISDELDVEEDERLEKMETMYRPNKLTKRSNVVKENTGFCHVVELLSTSVVMSKGDFDILQYKSTYLSWFEAWYLYYNVVYGRASYRWCDTANRFRTSKTTSRKLHREKLGTCIDGKMSWPMLATNEEDILFRKDDWNKKEYDNKRVIMHDNTNIDLCKPGCGEAQRLTFILLIIMVTLGRVVFQSNRVTGLLQMNCSWEQSVTRIILLKAKY